MLKRISKRRQNSIKISKIRESKKKSETQSKSNEEEPEYVF